MHARYLPALLSLAAGLAQAAGVSLDKTIPGFATPESVVVAGADVFVSNLGLKLEPFEKDGDGFIARLDRRGNVKSLKWQAGLNAPKGMLYLGGVLYVVDIDRLLGFRVRDGKPVFELDLAATGSKFLNALAAWDARHLLVSATDLGKVFMVDLAGKAVSELAFDTPPKGPNGIKKSGNRLIVAEWGSDNQPNGTVKTYRLSGMNARLERDYALTPPGYFDGVVDLGANRWLVSNWVKFEPAGLLQLLDLRTGQVTVANPGLPMAGPADIFVDDAGKLWVPGMLEGKVYRLTVRP